MTHAFDKDYWDQHWRERSADGAVSMATNPYLASEVAHLVPGTALDAGCGTGAEALWLSSRGWRVTAADISSAALADAQARAASVEGGEQVRWVEADLTTWEPGTLFDLVMTHYAHPTMPQLDFYDRIAQWVAPGGTLLIVGHLHTHDATGDDGHPPAEASVTSAAITDRLDDSGWRVVTADERTRSMTGDGDPGDVLHDVVVRAERLA